MKPGWLPVCVTLALASCLSPSSECPDGFCRNGTCERGDGGWVCRCRIGWAGERCEVCADGYREQNGVCLPQDPCDPNPCRHGTCSGAGGGAVCACEAGWAGERCDRCAEGLQDNDGDGRCRPDCAHSGLTCDPLTCRDDDGEAKCVGTRPCSAWVRYRPERPPSGQVFVRSEWNQWGFDEPLLPQPDGSLGRELRLPPGDYAYKFYEADGDRWFIDEANPYTKWIAGVQNSRLRVPDCERPLLYLARPVENGTGTISFAVQAAPGRTGTALDASSARASRNRLDLPGVFDAGTGRFEIRIEGLPPGKHSFRFEIRDAAGRSAEPFYLPLWIETEPFDWRDAVLYFPMTDRFRNGDALNDGPAVSVESKANWQGGDFAGLRAAVEDGFFEDLGVNALWLSSLSKNTALGWPGSDGRSYSGYHSYWPVSSGHSAARPLSSMPAIETHFGSAEELRRLIDSAHARGMRVIADLVLNHVHQESPLWAQHQNDQPPWFSPLYVCGWDRPIECWFAPYLPDIDYTNLDALETMIGHAAWLLAEFDLDGYRVDAVKHFIHDVGWALRARLDETVGAGARPFLVGETFTGEDGAGQIAEYLGPRELDGQFDFPLYWQVVKTFLREEEGLDRLAERVEDVRAAYGGAVMSNFLGNHDVCRALSHAAGDIADLWGNGSREQGWNHPPALPLGEAPFQRLRAAWTFLFAMPGVPLVYYGDEFGLEGAGDPDNRRPMRFSGHTPQQLATQEHVRRLAFARRAHPALRRGEPISLLLDGDGRFWAYGMRHGSDAAVAVFNLDPESRARSIPVGALGLSDGQVLHDAVGGGAVPVSGGTVALHLSGRATAVLVEPDACHPNPCREPGRSVCEPLSQGRHRCRCDAGSHEFGGVCVPVCSGGQDVCLAARPSFYSLPSANGHGVAVYDVLRRRVADLFEHPYQRFDESEITRDVLWDSYLGLRAPGANVWLSDVPLSEAGYLQETGIVRVRQEIGALAVETFAYAPFELARPALVVIGRVQNRSEQPVSVSLYSLHNFHLGRSSPADPVHPDSAGERVVVHGDSGSWVETGPAGVVVHRPLSIPSHRGVTPDNPYEALRGGRDLSDNADSGVGDDRVAGFQKDFRLDPAGEGWFGVVSVFSPAADETVFAELQAVFGGRSESEALEQALASWEAWRKPAPPGLAPAERSVFRQSEALLRQGQVREDRARARGQILASLPPGAWNIAWVRDMCYAAVALARLGHLAEAREALQFMLQADAGYFEEQVGAPYQISVVRYFGNGREESDTNADGPNIEFDGFGLFLWALKEYIDASGDEAWLDFHWPTVQARVAQVLVGLVDPASGLIRPDSSIWEVHWNGREKRFAYTSATAARGLCAAADLAQARGEAVLAESWRSAGRSIRNAMMARLREADGALAGSLEEMIAGTGARDVAVVEALNAALFDPQGATARATLDAIERDLGSRTGLGFFRNDDGGWYDSQEWAVAGLWMSAAARRAGRAERAERLLGWITAQALANFNLVAELHDPASGAYLGAVPMIGYGAGAYVLAQLERLDASPRMPVCGSFEP